MKPQLLLIINVILYTWLYRLRRKTQFLITHRARCARILIDATGVFGMLCFTAAAYNAINPYVAYILMSSLCFVCIVTLYVWKQYFDKRIN